MGRIQSNVGLITGIPITDTINQLIGVSAQPRDILTARTQGLQQQQVAVNTLASRVLSLKFDLDQLKVSDPFQSRTLSSSNEEVLSATILEDAQPPLGTFTLRPARTASSQQFISQRFESVDDIPSVGSLSFGKGGFVDKGISLDELNDGSGVSRGEIKITDRDGNSAVIDLSLVRTVDDVVTAINNETNIDVTASTDGNSFVLTDVTGGTGNLRVQEVNGGSTAADLGLAAINTSNASATGAEVYGLHAGTKLSTLNDGNGVRIIEGLEHLEFSNRDGDVFTVNLDGAQTVGDVIDAINNNEDNAGSVTASIDPDGTRLQLTTSNGPADFQVSNPGGVGSVADDLGLVASVSAETITGSQLVSGLSGTLVSSLRGGAGVALESIDVTDRSGANAEIDLSGIETLQGIVDTINAEAGVSVQATINENRNGITITDTSGGNGNLTIANGSSGSTADDLGITVDELVDSVDSGTLGRQSISESTLLSTLNGGEGTTAGDINIVDSNGNTSSFDFNKSGEEPKTIGDIIDAINQATSEAQANTSLPTDKQFNVTARINDTGDGIVLVDNAEGDGTLSVENVNGTLADDLNLTRTAETVDVDGTDRQVIDGTSSFSVDLTNLEETSSSISLDSLNNGNGVILGDIRITNSKGKSVSLDLNSQTDSIKTVDQLLAVINEAASDIDVSISITESGTGLKIVDEAGGDDALKVEDINGSLAAELDILSTSSTTTSITSIGLFDSQDESQGALNNLATQINDLDAGVTASVFSDGSGFRLQISVDEAGAANEILLDERLTGFDFDEVTRASDALLVVGEGAIPGSGVLVSSPTNNFENIVDGTTVSALQTSDTAIDLTVAASDQEIVDRVQSFVDSYNSLRDNLGDLTSFDEDDLSTGLLFGTTEALQVDTSLSRLVTDRYRGVGDFSTLQEVGISVGDDGKLSLDTSQLKEAFENDASSLETFFSAETNGVVAKFNAAIDRLTDAESGILTNRNESLQATIDQNEARITRFNESLERQRARLELEFFQLEQVISNLQSSQQAVGAIQGIPPLTSTSRLGQ